jgi:hypothetical protein
VSDVLLNVHAETLLDHSAFDLRPSGDHDHSAQCR